MKVTFKTEAHLKNVFCKVLPAVEEVEALFGWIII